MPNTSPLACCMQPKPDPTAPLYATYLVARESSVNLALSRVPAASPGVTSLAPSLLHMPLCDFSAAPKHVAALGVCTRAAGKAGTATASRRELWNIGAASWARVAEADEERDVWAVVLWERVLASVCHVFLGDGVKRPREMKVGSKKGLGIAFGKEGKDVRETDVARFLSMITWDVALVRKMPGEGNGEVKVLERWPVGPVDELLPGQSYGDMDNE